MNILVGSQNPVKIEAVKEAFSKFFDNVNIIGIKVDSKVSNQPINDETFEGAKNRALELKKINEERNLGAKFFVGIEAGITKIYSKWSSFSGLCIADDKGRIGFGTTPHYELPDRITKELLNGIEFGDVMDKIIGDHNTKQKGGAVGFFTKGIIDRKKVYTQSLIIALIPFVNEKLYFEK